MQAQGTFSLLTATSVANLLAGQVYEWLRQPSWVEVGIVQSATGLIASVACDSDIVMQDVGQTNIPIKATPPVYPDEYLAGFACMGGSRIIIALRNPTAGTLTGFYAVRITAL